MASAGKILIMPKGNWDKDTTYEMLDLVSHNGGSWIAKKTVLGIEPTEANTEYWQNMMKENIENFTFAEGFYGRKHGDQVTIYFHGYQINGTEQGSGGNVGQAYAPIHDAVFPVVVQGVGLGIAVINTAGYVSLYNADQSQYISGSISGVVSYLINIK